MESIRLVIRDILQARIIPSKKRPCCPNFIGQDYNFCPTCGMSMSETVPDVRPEDIQDFWLRLHTQEIDLASETLRIFETAGWGLGSLFEPLAHPPVNVQGFSAWLSREDVPMLDITNPDEWGVDDGWCEAQYPNGSNWNSRDGDH